MFDPPADPTKADLLAYGELDVRCLSDPGGFDVLFETTKSGLILKGLSGHLGLCRIRVLMAN
jgi:hypothetical protein